MKGIISMTALLQKAFGMASKLPSYEQECLASRWIDELESDQRWEQLFRDSEDVLEYLADEALKDLENGMTEEKRISKP